MCGAPSYFPPLLQMKAAFTTSFISSSGGVALPGGPYLQRERFTAANKGGGLGTGHNYFFGMWPCIGEGTVCHTCHDRN